MRTHRTLGLRSLLVLLVLMAVLPGVLVVVVASVAEQRQQVADARAVLESTTRLVAANQEQLVGSVRYALTAMAAAPALRRAELEPLCTDFMSAMRDEYPSFSNFGLIDMSGRLTCQGEAHGGAIYAGDRLYYKRALATGEFAVGEFIVGRVSGRPALSFGLPVIAPDRKPRGVVFASLDLARANAQFKSLDLPTTFRVHVSDAQGHLLLSNADTSPALGQPLPEPQLRDAVKNTRIGAFDGVDDRGEVWLHRVQAIGSIQHDGLFVTVSTRRDDAVGPSIARLQLQLLALALATLGGLALAWVYGNGTVAEPARRLLARMQAFERGEAAPTSPQRVANTELAALNDGFTELAQRVQQRERESAELLQRLAQQREQLRSAQRMSRITYWFLDIPSQSVTWSDTPQEVLGFTPLAGTQAMADYLTHVHPDDVERVRQGQVLARSGNLPDVEHRVLRDDGSVGWLHALGKVEFDASGAPLRFIGSLQDVTERKRAEEALSALVDRLQTLREMDRALLEARSVEQICAIGTDQLLALTRCWGAGVTLFDFDTGMTQLMSSNARPGTLQAAGAQWPLEDYGLDDLARLRRGELCRVDDLSLAGRQPIGLQRLMHLGMRAYLRVPMLDDGRLLGALSLAKNHATPFNEAEVEVARALADRIALALREATLRARIDAHAQQLEQRVAERTAEVEAANRELEAFSYSVSHDLRAPLQAIDGFGRALQQRQADRLDDQGRHYLERIRVGTLHMAQLIEDLLSLARVSRTELRMSDVNLADIARAAIERLRAADPERRVDVAMPDQLTARGDPRLLGIVLNNLLDNAWKFTGKTARPRIEIGTARRADGHAEFFVADNGAGFDMRYADKLFGAFQRLHSSSEFPGTGIGLATVQRIVQRHGGTIHAESVPDVRTVVRFTLGWHSPA